MTVTIHTRADLDKVLRALDAQSSDEADDSVRESLQATCRVLRALDAQSSDEADDSVRESLPATRKEETKAKPEKAAEVAKPEAAQALHGPAKPLADVPTYQDAATAITKLSKIKGRDAAVAVLSAFGAARLPDVKPEQFADIIAEAEKAGSTPSSSRT